MRPGTTAHFVIDVLAVLLWRMGTRTSHIAHIIGCSTNWLYHLKRRYKLPTRQAGAPKGNVNARRIK